MEPGAQTLCYGVARTSVPAREKFFQTSGENYKEKGRRDDLSPCTFLAT
ncbi:hypothetical protein I41_10930 [Lacipirellula limnantheis]|uniref:Uncharacterized protein n=1 Tax=Lacipirellula limnantheis TaxID=2528024 RepID=A0A517TU64_9BACT|nr:hypothetical protein I41_10930 [Lacipirellula limnantheis]